MADDPGESPEDTGSEDTGGEDTGGEDTGRQATDAREVHGHGWGTTTRAIRAGRANSGEALAPVLWSSAAFISSSPEAARDQASTVAPPRFYSRYGNPSVADFESAIADLEGAEAARAYASGMGALTGVVLGVCSTGDHIVTQRQLYGGTHLLFQAVCPRMGIDVTYVDAAEPGAFAAAIQPGRTTLVVAETPANPRLDLVDLAELGAIAGPVTVVDSTLATPVVQRPLDHGVDLVVHSATKGIVGHNDATLGVAAGQRELIDWLWSFAVLQGAVASPFDAVAGVRGLRTLGVRVPRQAATALALAGALEADHRVTAVSYPGLSSHPQRALAERQMTNGGVMLSFDLAGGSEAGRAMLGGLNLAQLATSLGGPETLVTHPASTTHVGLSGEELAAASISPGTVRVSVGLEDPDDVVADLIGALDAAA